MKNGLHNRRAKRKFKMVTLADGTEIRLRSLLRAEQREWKVKTQKPAEAQFSDDVLLALCIVDADGNQEISTEDALTGFFDSWDMGECQTLLRHCMELCFPEQYAETFGTDVVAALKNSKTTTGNGSSGPKRDGSESQLTTCEADST